MLTRITARFTESLQPKETAMERGQAALRQAHELINKTSDQALERLNEAKAALKRALPNGDEAQIKLLLGEVYLKSADILQLTKGFSVEEVRVNYIKAQKYFSDPDKQEEVQERLNHLPGSSTKPKIQRRSTIPPSSVPAAPHLSIGLPAQFFVDSTSPSSASASPISYRLVGPNEITDTRHLAWCLQQTDLKDESFNLQKQLHSLAREAIERFGKRVGKDLECMQEVAVLAKIPHAEFYSLLISHTVKSFNAEGHIPLNVALVQGLAVMVRNCPASLLKKENGISPDVWSSVLEVLLKCLENTHRIGNPVQLQELLRAISQLLDTMGQAGVVGISRTKLQLPLNNLLREKDSLNPDKDAEISWQIRYAREALAHIPNDESWAEATLRCLFGATKGILSLASAIKNCDIDTLLESFDRFEKAFAGARIVAREVTNAVGAIGGLKEAIANAQEAGAFFQELQAAYQDRSRQKGWYTALQCMDSLIEANQLVKFEQFVRKSAYRENPDFLQGVCQRLERIACSQEDEEVQKKAIQFLKNLEENTVAWMNQASSKYTNTVSNKAKETLDRLNERSALPPAPVFDGTHVPPAWDPAWEAKPSTQLLDKVRRHANQEAMLSQVRLMQQRLLPQTISLTDLREALYQHYQLSNLSIQRVSGQQASLADCYINLAIVESHAQRKKDQEELKKQAVAFERLPSSERLEATNLNKLVPLDQLFETQKLCDGSEGMPKRILIQGRAGIGKTTLCKKIVYEYRHNRLWQDRFDCVLWVPLRQFKTHQTHHLEKLLSDHYFASLEKRQAQALAQVFKQQHQDKTLFILDGLDEVVGELGQEGTTLSRFLKELLNQAHVVITSRPAGVSTDLLGQLDLELETVGFSPDNVQAYIQKFAPELNQAAIQQFIHSTPLLQGLVNIPIQLDALCYSWDECPKIQEVTMTTLYQAMVDELWRKDSVRLEKEDYKGETLSPSEIQNLSNAKLERLMADKIHYLSYLAFKGLEAEKIEFSFNELNQRQNEFEAQTPLELSYSFGTDLRKTSFLHTADADEPLESKRSYHFLHLTFQEFFAAKFLVRHLQANAKPEGTSASAKVASTSLGVMASQKELEAFIVAHKYNPRYEIVWWMVAGLLKEAALERFFTLLQDAPRDLIGIRHQQVIMGCLNEARTQLDKTTVDRLETELMQWLHFEMKLSKYGPSKLGCQRAFPEHQLLKCLNQREGRHKEIINTLEKKIINTLGARPALSVEAILALINALQHSKKWPVRSAAAYALGRQKTLSDNAILALIDALKDKEGDVRSAAAQVLRQQETLSDDAVKALIVALKDKERSIRFVAAQALGQQKTLSDDAIKDTIKALIVALKDKESSVRFMAAQALGQQKRLSKKANLALIDALKDKERSVRFSAAQALGQQAAPSDNAILALIEALKGKEEFVRSAATQALGQQKTQSEGAVQVLIGALHHENKDVRYEAARALEKQKTQSEGAVQALIDALKDKERSVRSAAAQALGQQRAALSDNAILALIDALKDDKEWSVRSAAAQALGQQRAALSDNAILALIDALKDDEGYVKFSAAQALGQQAALSDNAILALIDALQDKEGYVRSAAAQALGQRAVPSEKAISALITALQDKEGEGNDIRSAAAKILDLHMDQLYTALPSLAFKQIQTLYTEILLPQSFRHIASLYIQGNKLHFYTAMGPGQPKLTSEEQRAMLIQAFRGVRAEAGIALLPEEKSLLTEK